MGIVFTGSYDRADRGSDVLDATYGLLLRGGEYQLEALTSQLQDREELRKRFGGNLVLDYKIPNGNLMYSGSLSQLNREEVIRGYEVQQDGGTRWRLNDREVSVKMFTNILSGEHGLFNGLLDWRMSYTKSKQNDNYDFGVSFINRGDFSPPAFHIYSPSELHDLPNNDISRAAWGYDTSFNIDESIEEDFNSELNMNLPFTATKLFSGQLKFGAKYMAKNRKRDLSYLVFPGYQSVLVFEELFPERDFKRINYDLAFDNSLDENYETGKFLDEQYEISAYIDKEFMREFMRRGLANADNYRDYFHENNQSRSLDYRSTEKVSAAYVMSEFNITPKLMFIAGIRAEHVNTDNESVFAIDQGQHNDYDMTDTTAVHSYTEWFPMFHLRYKINSWSDIRLARTRAYSRPSFRDIIPYSYVNFFDDVLNRGEPYLKPTTVINYDAILSVYTNSIGLFSIGGFYKELDDVIYNVNRNLFHPDRIGLGEEYQNLQLTQPENTQYTAHVKGFEIDWQTNFSYLPAPFNSLVLNINFAKMWSELQVPVYKYQYEYENLTEPPWFRVTILETETSRTNRLLFQPDRVLNLSLGYDLKGFSGRLSLIYQTDVLTAIGIEEEVDSYTGDYFRWDLSLKQKITNALSVYFNMYNVTNQPDRAFQKTTGFPTYIEYYGWISSLGFQIAY
jgi:TonB-dependent receptor